MKDLTPDLVTPDLENVHGARRVGERVAHAARATSWPDAVRTLQAGINRVAADPPAGLALKQGVAALGSPAILRAFDEEWRMG